MEIVEAILRNIIARIPQKAIYHIEFANHQHRLYGPPKEGQEVNCVTCNSRQHPEIIIDILYEETDGSELFILFEKYCMVLNGKRFKLDITNPNCDVDEMCYRISVEICEELLKLEWSLNEKVEKS